MSRVEPKQKVGVIVALVGLIVVALGSVIYLAFGSGQSGTIDSEPKQMKASARSKKPAN